MREQLRECKRLTLRRRERGRAVEPAVVPFDEEWAKCAGREPAAALGKQSAHIKNNVLLRGGVGWTCKLVELCCQVSRLVWSATRERVAGVNRSDFSTDTCASRLPFVERKRTLRLGVFDLAPLFTFNSFSFFPTIPPLLQFSLSCLILSQVLSQL